jgi:hypothetical protein
MHLNFGLGANCFAPNIFDSGDVMKQLSVFGGMSCSHRRGPAAMDRCVLHYRPGRRQLLREIERPRSCNDTNRAA